MPTFDIIRKSELPNTYRTARIKSDFDVEEKHLVEHFSGEIKCCENWNIGVIVGASGTGKSTIAKELWGDKMYSEKFGGGCVIDEMPSKVSVDEIEKMFYAVGFGSVPSWLKPYHVLSNGEKMRVDLARSLLENDFVVFDEFTSVVDRNVARVASLAIQKAVRKQNKKFIAVTCHEDVIEWLQPDWIFDTNKMQNDFFRERVRKSNAKSENVGAKNGKYLGVIII